MVMSTFNAHNKTLNFWNDFKWKSKLNFKSSLISFFFFVCCCCADVLRPKYNYVIWLAIRVLSREERRSQAHKKKHYYRHAGDYYVYNRSTFPL